MTKKTAKRAVKPARKATDKRVVGSAQNPTKVAAPTAKKTATPPVAAYKRSTAGGGAGRPKKVK